MSQWRNSRRTPGDGQGLKVGINTGPTTGVTRLAGSQTQNVLARGACRLTLSTRSDARRERLSARLLHAESKRSMAQSWPSNKRAKQPNMSPFLALGHSPLKARRVNGRHIQYAESQGRRWNGRHIQYAESQGSAALHGTYSMQRVKAGAALHVWGVEEVSRRCRGVESVANGLGRTRRTYAPVPT
ncbi:hypothetical protein PMIN01_07956 [Paraphaeosphaeria minitans]|uniref:Uncharacterized protein n=1 Tax=Paraphaeosphaeria minitans TaxID=565426 RepID=A0A9P6KNH4_9PLEO|nr:hypothetical protein PMIN01_07956 [Paraphaeosphaeria minitans]